MPLSQELQQFKETETGETFSLQNDRLLKVELAGVTVQAKAGSMVAYQGEVKFEHAGSGGIGRLLKKMATGEGVKLMKVSGTGEVFLADIRAGDPPRQARGRQHHRQRSEPAGLRRRHRLGHQEGRGRLGRDRRRALQRRAERDGHGRRALRRPAAAARGRRRRPTFADPQAAITWSSGVKTSVKTDVSLKTLIGRASGETIQIAFSGSGWLLIQPSEGRVSAGAPAEAGARSATSSAADFPTRQGGL